MSNSPRKARMRLGDISVNFLHAMAKAIQLAGKDHLPLFERYQISDNLLNTPNARISIPRFMRIGHDAITLTNNKALGLIIGQNMHIGDIGITGLTAATSGDLATAMSTLIRFELLNSKNSRGHSSFYKEHDHTVCQFYSISPYNRYNHFVVDTTLSSWAAFAKWLTNKEELLQKVDVEYSDDSYKDEMERYFQCPVHFGQVRNAILFRNHSGNLSSNYANQGTYKQGIMICEREYNRITSDSSITDRVIDLIGPSLNRTPPTIEDIAQLMGSTSWTLRRKLKKEKTRYSELLDQTRKELAESYVLDTNLNFTEIAFLLGFSSPAAFQRAFKRWVTLSPGDYRRNFVKADE